MLNKIFQKEAGYFEEIILKNGCSINFSTFRDRPFHGSNTIITQGINDFSDCSKDFIFIFSDFTEELKGELIALIATYLDFHYFKYECNISYGDILYVPNFELISGYNFEAFYTLHPAYFKGILDIDNYIWLLPIFKDEYDFLKKHGSSCFQDILVEKDPDLSNLKRASLI